ncbi:hypothetical protein [Campylobacter sp. MG1]|uniref:hypothetical protein n=1 Tax=Campylobacter sp. MG1 TaxID=2976332 RepID=UPI00226D3699|nr:hypothetical protein [Campylobacter sp. MG1]
MQEEVKKLATEFNKFVKDNSLELIELEQANFILACENNVRLDRIAENLVSQNLLKIYSLIKFNDIEYYVDSIRKSHFSFNDKRNAILLILASRCNRYANTLVNVLKDDEIKFIHSYIKANKDFVNYCFNNENDLALFLHDMNAFRKYFSNDKFLMPLKLSNSFNSIKREINLKNILKIKESLFLSRRKFYNKLDIHKDIIKKYEKFEKKLNNIIESYKN